MADGQMSIDEVRDLLRFLEDRNDFYADPFSRVAMGGGYFDEAAFEPTREYIDNPTPVENWLRGLAAQGGNTLDSLIAMEIEGGGTPLSALTSLQQMAASDPEFASMLPTYQDQMGAPQPDWKLVEKTAQKYWDDYRAEQDSLSQYLQDEEGRYYTETPSEAAEKFRSLGLPLPTEQYTDQLGAGPGAYQQVMGEQQALARELMRGAGNEWQAARAGLQDAETQLPQNMPGFGSPKLGAIVPPAEMPAFSNSVEGRKMRERWEAGDIGIGGSEMPAFSNSVEGRRARQQWEDEQAARGLAPEGGDEPGYMAVARMAGLSPALMDNLGAAAGDPQAGFRAAGRREGHARERAAEMQQARARMAAEQLAQFNAMFTGEAMRDAGARYGMRDLGQTPLADMMNSMNAQFGMPSQFQPMIDESGYARNDRRNPNFRQNLRAAYQEFRNRG